MQCIICNSFIIKYRQENPPIAICKQCADKLSNFVKEDWDDIDNADLIAELI